MKTTKKSKSNDAQGNIIPAISAAAAKLDFAKSVKIRDGANNYVEKFLLVMSALTNLKATGFTLQDCFQLAQPYELPAADVKYLFQKWCGYMQRINKITIIEGCFDEPIICLV